MRNILCIYSKPDDEGADNDGTLHDDHSADSHP